MGEAVLTKILLERTLYVGICMCCAHARTSSLI